MTRYISPEEMNEKFRRATNKFRSVKEAAAHFGINPDDCSRYRSTGKGRVNVPQHIAKRLGYIRTNAYELLEDYQQNDVLEANEYFIGQRVLLNNTEVGTVVKSETGHQYGIWVFSPLKGFASDYGLTSVRPLPNGEL